MTWARIGVIALIFAAALSLHQVNEERNQPAPKPTECEVGHVNPDGTVTITEQSAGRYGYTIYATASGTPLVMGDCN